MQGLHSQLDQDFTTIVWSFVCQKKEYVLKVL